jgi:hypothetical protein
MIVAWEGILEGLQETNLTSRAQGYRCVNLCAAATHWQCNQRISNFVDVEKGKEILWDEGRRRR